MFNKKTIGIALASFGILSLSASASAEALYIKNHTNYPSTCKIAGKCSSRLPSHGVTPANGENSIPSPILKAACLGQLHNCVAHIYMNATCDGKEVAIATFDVSSGLKSLQKLTDDYHVNGSGFHFEIFPGPGLNK